MLFRQLITELQFFPAICALSARSGLNDSPHRNSLADMRVSFRGQGTLFPEHLDDYVAKNNPARVIDALVDELDLGKLGFERA